MQHKYFYLRKAKIDDMHEGLLHILKSSRVVATLSHVILYQNLDTH